MKGEHWAVLHPVNSLPHHKKKRVGLAVEEVVEMNFLNVSITVVDRGGVEATGELSGQKHL